MIGSSDGRVTIRPKPHVICHVFDACPSLPQLGPQGVVNPNFVSDTGSGPHRTGSRERDSEIYDEIAEDMVYTSDGYLEPASVARGNQPKPKPRLTQSGYLRPEDFPEDDVDRYTRTPTRASPTEEVVQGVYLHPPTPPAEPRPSPAVARRAQLPAPPAENSYIKLL